MLFDASLQESLKKAIEVAETHGYKYIQEFAAEGRVSFAPTFERKGAIVGVNVGVTMDGKSIPGRESKIELIDQVYYGAESESGGV